MNIDRRNFMLSAAALATAAGAAQARASAGGPAAAPDGDRAAAPPPARSAPGRNRRPYSGIDWKTAHQIKTTSHVHCKTQEDLDVMLKRGFGLITLSNYYPSAPWCPLAKMTENYFRVHHDHAVTIHHKGRKEGPVDWNAIVGEWIKDLPEEMQKQFPFTEGGAIFKPLPEGVLEAPNAEHFNFVMADGHRSPWLHMNGLGSAFASGTFDQWQSKRFKTFDKGGYDPGTGEPWRKAVDRMLAGLVHPDGGGVTVNHPTWTGMDRNFLLELLDYDPRVLGIEVIESATGNNEFYWDWVLATGRQCFGFFVPDHFIRREDGAFGVNVLVTHERTVHGCLKAYRDGDFYGAKKGLGELAFKRISFDGKTVEAETDRPAHLIVRTARGRVAQVKNGTSIKWSVPQETSALGPRRNIDVFVRVKAGAIDGSGEELFSQPFMIG